MIVQSTWSMIAALGAEQLGGMGEEQVRRRALPLRVGRREMLADVAEPGRAEQRVGDRVEDDVGIAVAGESARVGNRDAAEHHRAVAGEAVDVEADAGPRDQPRREPLLRRAAKSAGVVSLSSSGSPSTAATLSPAARATWSRRSAERPGQRS